MLTYLFLLWRTLAMVSWYEVSSQLVVLFVNTSLSGLAWRCALSACFCVTVLLSFICLLVISVITVTSLYFGNWLYSCHLVIGLQILLSLCLLCTVFISDRFCCLNDIWILMPISHLCTGANIQLTIHCLSNGEVSNCLCNSLCSVVMLYV